MGNPVSSSQIADAISKYGLSERAARNSLQPLPWDAVEAMLPKLWTSDNPDGLVFLGVAENSLQYAEVANYITNNLAIDRRVLSYGAGPRGSPRLRMALASFFNSDFQPHEPVLDKNVLILPGAVAVLDALAWAICNEGEGIIVTLPFYTGFKAVGERARGVLVPASFQSLGEYQGLDDIFEPEMNKQALEGAIYKATQDGVRIRAVMLCNPHNPLGRCYPAETLREVARFCGRRKLHLISDEVFAKSAYNNPQADAHLEDFTSVLALDLGDCIDRELVHVAYGMGKDFCANGLRLGALHTRNGGLLAAVASTCMFGWPSYAIQDIWASMLEDKVFLAAFVARNQALLAEHCAILIAFLNKQAIPYYKNVNAGCFVWVDLRRYLYDSGTSIDLSTRRLAPLEVDTYRDREARLFKRCMEGGIGISPGTSFSSEEPGWFRISFAVEKEALYTGLGRLQNCLQEIDGDGWV